MKRKKLKAIILTIILVGIIIIIGKVVTFDLIAVEENTLAISNINTFTIEVVSVAPGATAPNNTQVRVIKSKNKYEIIELIEKLYDSATINSLPTSSVIEVVLFKDKTKYLLSSSDTILISLDEVKN